MLLPLGTISAVSSGGLNNFGSLWMPGACSFGVLLGTLSEPRFGPREATMESFILRLLFFFLFLVDLLVLLNEDSLFFGFW